MNPHELPRSFLKAVRLPIPPLRRGGASLVGLPRSINGARWLRAQAVQPRTDGLDDATRALFKQQAVVLLLLAIATAAMVGRSRPGRG